VQGIGEEETINVKSVRKMLELFHVSVVRNAIL